ncbi:peptide deformylase [Nocardioides xinjiangensis]|uniref:peptide deformylase n=1 Tax=Nocardioides xinjiangensis TaxID=2817376 RepID=UPI001B300C01|nr:peptide deformylase [Nocardioides sp. SYSU D00778]
MSADRPTDAPAEPRAPHGPLPEGGRVRPITRWGTPVMHRPQAGVTTYDEALAALAADMVATMYAADGVGLAACQVGEDVAMFVFDCPDADGVRTVGVVCNPVLTLPEGRDRRLEDDDEGCLSFPGSFESCPRPDWARVDGQGLDGQPVSFEGTGLLARCLQHETDHTLGTVFGDRLSAKARKRLERKHQAAAEDYPPTWPADASA